MNNQREASQVTTVYLIHFERPFWHAQHYLGYTANLSRRIEQHRNGTGAKLLRAIAKHGISWEVVRTWPGGPTLERALKSRKKSRELCPVCIQQRWFQSQTSWSSPLAKESVPQLQLISEEVYL